MYNKVNGSVVMFLMSYVDDILLIGNDVSVLQSVKIWLSNNFSMIDLGEATYILGINIYRDILIGRFVLRKMCTSMCTSACVASSNIMISEYRYHGELGY